MNKRYFLSRYALVSHFFLSFLKLFPPMTFHVDSASTNVSDLMIFSCTSPFFHEISSSKIPYQCF